jgi:hypothetical protein
VSQIEKALQMEKKLSFVIFTLGANATATKRYIFEHSEGLIICANCFSNLALKVDSKLNLLSNYDQSNGISIRAPSILEVVESNISNQEILFSTTVNDDEIKVIKGFHDQYINDGNLVELISSFINRGWSLVEDDYFIRGEILIHKELI